MAAAFQPNAFQQDAFQPLIIISVQGAITELPDSVSSEIEARNALIGEIVENPDVVNNVINVKYKYRGGWAPQFNYKRDWEKEPEVVIEEEIVLEAEPEPEFIPTPLPIDPAVARMIAAMMQGPAQIDNDEDDIEAILLHM